MQLRPQYAAKQTTTEPPIGRAARRVPPPPKPPCVQLGNLGQPPPAAPLWQQWPQPPVASWTNQQSELAIRSTGTQHKVIYDIVEGLGSQSQAMVSQLTNTFATAQTTTQSQVMQCIQSLHTSQSAQNERQMNQMAECQASQMEILRSVMLDVIHMVKPAAPPVQPIPPATPPPNWMLSGGSSGSGGENPTGYQGTNPEWAHPDWSEPPTASAEYPGWASQRTWTAAPAPSAVRCTVFVRPPTGTAPTTPPPEMTSPPPVPAEMSVEEVEPIEPDDDRWRRRVRSRGWGSGWHDKDHHRGSGHQNI